MIMKAIKENRMQIDLFNEDKALLIAAVMSCSSWISIAEELPPAHTYVLARSHYCKHPADIAYYNGYGFKSVNHGKFYNVIYWAKIITENLPEFDRAVLEKHQDELKPETQTALNLDTILQYFEKGSFAYLSGEGHWYIEDTPVSRGEVLRLISNDLKNNS